MTDILIGFTDYTKTIFIPDPASTDGSGKTGLIAANLTASYTRVETDNDVVVTDVTSSLNDLAALTTAHTDWGLKEVSSTLAPGLYRLDIADAVFAAGAWSAVVYVMITTSAAAASPIEFNLVGYNKLDGVGLGLTALPPAAANAAGGLIISVAGGLDADAQRADVAAILVDTGTTLDARIPAALVGGRMDSSTGAVAAGAIGAAAFAANAIDAAALAADAVAEIADGVWDEAIAGHLTAGSTGAALNAAGSAGDPWATALPGAYGAGTAGFIIGNDVPDILADTAEIGVAGAGLTNINLPNQTMDIVGTITTVTNLTNLPAITANWLTAAGIAADAGAEIADALLDRDMSTGTDSGSTTVRTPRQALRALRNKWTNSAGTYTVYKEDDTTSSWTGTVSTDAAADPIVGNDPAG